MKHILPMPPGIKWNQWNTPACVGFACTLAQKIKLYELTNKWIPLSPYSVYGCHRSESGGLHLRYGLDALRDFGALPSYEWDEPCANPECYKRLKLYRKKHPEAYVSAARFKLRQYREVRDFDDIRAEIDAGNPIVMALDIDGAFGKRDKGIEPRILSPGTIRSHAVCIVGYTDDNYMIARNSHGESDNGGFVYFPKGRPFDCAYALCDIGTSIAKKARHIELPIKGEYAEVDGKLTALDTPAYIKGGRTFVPVRFVAESLGAAVEWDASTSTATIKSEEAVVKLTEKKRTMYVNGKAVEMDVAPEIVGTRLCVPIRYIAENLNCRADWDAARNRAIIISI